MNRVRASKAATAPWYDNPANALNSVLPSFIHDYTNQKYWDSVNGETNGFPVATLRSSNATTIDREGRIAWAPHQLCSRGQTFSSWSIGGDGTVTLSGNTAPTGSPSYYATWTTPTPTTGCQLGGQAVVVGANMTASIYLRYVNHEWVRLVIYASSNTSSQNRCWINLREKRLYTIGNGLPASNTVASIQDVGNGWMRVVISGLNPWANTTDGNLLVATCEGDSSSVRVGNGAAIEVASCIFEMTGAQTPQSWRPEFNTTGSAVYLPRFEYDHVTGEYRGLRIEPQQTNVITNCTATAAGWTTAGTTVTDGTPVWGFNVGVITGGTPTSQYAYYAGSALSATAGSSYSVSAFVKRGTSRYVQMATSANYNTPSTTAPYINYDFDTNTFATGGTNYIASSGFAQVLADGWVRLGMSFTANTTASGSSCLIAIVDSLAATRLLATTSTGLTVLSFGHQTESQGMVTSFIPTYGTAATRAFDNLTLSSIPWFNQTQGSIYVKAVPPQSDSVNTRRMVSFNDGTSANRYEVSRSSSNRINYVSAVGGVATFSPTSVGSTTDYTAYKTIATYSTSIRRVTLNGDVPATNATVGPSSGITTLIIGHAVGLPSANSFNGWIQEVRYYADASASDAQIQAMTV